MAAVRQLRGHSLRQPTSTVCQGTTSFREETPRVIFDRPYGPRSGCRRASSHLPTAIDRSTASDLCGLVTPPGRPGQTYTACVRGDRTQTSNNLYATKTRAAKKIARDIQDCCSSAGDHPIGSSAVSREAISTPPCVPKARHLCRGSLSMSSDAPCPFLQPSESRARRPPLPTLVSARSESANE